MKKTTQVTVCMALCLAVGATATGASQAEGGGLLEAADYEEFANVAGARDAQTSVWRPAQWHFTPEGVLDPELHNLKVNEIVLRGIASGQPRIEELTVLAMYREASQRMFGQPVVARTFSHVPGLKEYLIGYWHENMGDGPTTTAASAVPAILAVHYPADEDVHRLIWEQYDFTGNALSTLLALNVGRFRTPEADRLRIDNLSSDGMLTFAAAALGLAMSKPDRGLDALMTSLRDNPLSTEMRATRDAIAAYGLEAPPAIHEAVKSGELDDEAVRMLSEELEKIAAVAPQQ